MSIPILRTKLHRPQIDKSHLHRGHLLDKLEKGRNRPLVLVSAPAGYGKSTLVSCWLDVCDIPSAWISLDEHDSDLGVFLSYFLTAIQSIFPAVGHKTLSMLEAAQLPPIPVLAASLTRELDRIEKSFILVLDDYHHIRQKSVHELVAALMRHPSAYMHLVLIGRRDPPLPLTSLRAKDQVVEVRTWGLRFSLEETKAFLAQITGGAVDSDVAVMLNEKTEGWVTGLRLAVLFMREESDLKRKLADLPLENQYVMDYVVTEILCRQPPAVQMNMLKTSVLPRLNASLCDAVCRSDTDPGHGSPNSRNFLKLLENANLFVIPLDNEHQWFRYHHLFQSLLKRQLQKRLKAEVVLDLHRRASTWFAENGYFEEAIAHAHESQDKEAAAWLVKQHRHGIMNQEQWHRLDLWVKQFPADFIQEHPDLLLAKAWLYERQGRYSGFFAVLESLEQTASSHGPDSPGDTTFQGEMQVLKSFSYYLAAQGKLSETAARKALNCLPADYHCVRGFALLLLSAAIQMQGDIKQSHQVVLEAMRKDDESINTFKTALLIAPCFISWIEGDLHSLKHSAGRLLKYGRENDLMETIANGLFFNGVLHYQRNEMDLAERMLAPAAEGFVTGDQAIPAIVACYQSSFALSLTYQAMGRAEEARRLIESTADYMLEIGNENLMELCQAFGADLALRQGRVAEADSWARTKPPPPLKPVYRIYIPQLTLPKLLLARRTAESLNKAESLLSEIHAYYASIHSTRVLIDILVLQALIDAAQGRGSHAIEKLADALVLAEPGRFVRPFLDQGAEVKNLLGCMLQQNPTQSYARQILEAFGSETTASSSNRSEDHSRSRSSSQGDPLIQPMSNREIEVLKMLDKGVSNKEVADALFISPETVKRHLSTIYRKLDVKNRHQAVVGAKSLGIL